MPDTEPSPQFNALLSDKEDPMFKVTQELGLKLAQNAGIKNGKIKPVPRYILETILEPKYALIIPVDTSGIIILLYIE